MAGRRFSVSGRFLALGVSVALLFALVVTGSALAGFAKPGTLPVSGFVYAVDTGDLNGDGRTDLVAATNDQSRGLSVYLGKRDGFKSPKDYATGDFGASSVAIGRFNGDKLPDVAVSQPSPTAVQLWYSRPSGKLKKGPTELADQPLFALHATDVNGDGRTDLVGGTLFDGAGVVLKTKHGFGALNTYLIAPGATTGYSLTTGKVNGDKRADVLTYDSNGQISTLLSRSDGTLREYKVLDTATTNEEINGGLVVGDMDDDGKSDLVYAAGDDARLRVYPGKGDGTYKAPSVDRGSAAFPIGLDVADADGDGNLDAVVATRSNEPETVPYLFKGKGDGTFKQNYAPLPEADGDAPVVELARLDDDKRVDLILGGNEFINTYRGKR